ncbi:MAG: hypothetical protein KA118_10010 [Verrucomicrobia bacterium]|nr:hypothetical protein [Verrucomicrobiota bacterium]
MASSAPLPGGTPADPDAAPSLIVVAGAPGQMEYGSNFVGQARQWEAAARTAGVACRTIGLEPPGEAADLDRLKCLLEQEPRNGPAVLWLVLIGHGTFDGQNARFNLRGPDLTAIELAQWLQPFHRPLAILNTASSSGAFLPVLSATNRVIVTSTRSGFEQNYARFGSLLAESLRDPESDLDQDGQVSLLETFLSASHRVADFYQTSGRLATEHALLDDNGDRLGTPADWFRGIRAARNAREGAVPDGHRAHQIHLVPAPAELALGPEGRIRRDQIESDLERLRASKSTLPEEGYYRQLEVILLELARLLEGPASR